MVWQCRTTRDADCIGHMSILLQPRRMGRHVCVSAGSYIRLPCAEPVLDSLLPLGALAVLSALILVGMLVRKQDGDSLGIFMIFFVTIIVGALAVLFFGKETKGRTRIKKLARRSADRMLQSSFGFEQKIPPCKKQLGGICLSKHRRLFGEEGFERFVNLALLLYDRVHEFLMADMLIRGHQRTAAIVLVNFAVSEHIAPLHELPDPV